MICAENVVPRPNESILRSFQNPNFKWAGEISVIRIPESDLCSIRRINESVDSEREKYFGEMLQDCMANKNVPTNFKPAIKSWTAEVFQLCLLAFEIVLQLFFSGLDRAAAYPQHQSLFREAAKNWLCERFRVWTFPRHDDVAENRFITRAFKSAWEAFRKPTLPSWFATVRDVYVAIASKSFTPPNFDYVAIACKSFFSRKFNPNPIIFSSAHQSRD
jgi:hypothetical protein